MTGARGPWKKLKEIGKGSFGLVYLVERSNDSRKYVMKEVQLRGLPRAEMISAQNEVTVLKKLKVCLPASLLRQRASKYFVINLTRTSRLSRLSAPAYHRHRGCPHRG